MSRLSIAVLGDKRRPKALASLLVADLVILERFVVLARGVVEFAQREPHTDQVECIGVALFQHTLENRGGFVGLAFDIQQRRFGHSNRGQFAIFCRRSVRRLRAPRRVRPWRSSIRVADRQQPRVAGFLPLPTRRASRSASSKSPVEVSMLISLNAAILQRRIDLQCVAKTDKRLLAHRRRRPSRRSGCSNLVPNAVALAGNAADSGAIR